ncbi:hypothetical protein [Pseudoxanthomonas sp. 10H]|uniref:hypothetical protein n=1 Tax=Pseudoxanthomonas sp. 10H TaxID=3242729 RepID=UPI00355626B5
MKRAAPWLLLAGAVLCGAGAAILPRMLSGPVPGWLNYLLVVLGLVLAFVALLRWQLPEACDTAPSPLRRRYSRELMLAMGGYVLVLFASITLLRHVEAPALRAMVALLPVPPIALALRAMVRYIRDVDEMQQRIELEAVSLATGFISLVYMSAGFLQAARVIDVPASAALIWLFPLVCFTYGLAKAVVSRRYR